jgi:hypothetical protein
VITNSSFRAKARSGITLTEILIALVIMTVGMISLVTLFPLGLIRLRQAARLDRSAFLAESVFSDIETRELLSKSSFSLAWYGARDPFLVDTPYNASPAVDATAVYTQNNISFRPLSGGLPVCYDPMLRAVLPATPSFDPTPANAALRELRFGAGLVRAGANVVRYLRNDPQGGPASAWGLQRITNFLPYNTSRAWWPFVSEFAWQTFVSPDDVVFSSADNTTFTQFNALTGGSSAIGTPPSPLSPELVGKGNVVNDWRYSWFFTGRQTDVTSGQVFDGDIVVCDSRAFAVEALFSPISNSTSQVASGEYVFEAVFGYSGTILPNPIGYASGSDRTVVIRWPASVPDPEIKVGSWLADVTYERRADLTQARLFPAVQLHEATLGLTRQAPVYPMQRCYWYQVAKRTEPIDESAIGDAMSSAGWRRMTVYTTSPLQAKTLLRDPGNNNGTVPYHINAALFMPSVVNVFPRTVFVRSNN